jgi:hypothetical protein
MMSCSTAPQKKEQIPQEKKNSLEQQQINAI